MVNSGGLNRLPKTLYFGDYVDQNTRSNIYRIMYAQVARDFANTPRPTEITIKELHFYYDLLVPELIQFQKERAKNGK